MKFVVLSSHSKSEPRQDLVFRVVVCLVALGCLQLVVNLLQYATTRSLFNLENRCVMSSGSCATCTILISRFSLGLLNCVVGQLNGSCVSHCGPFHHNVADDKLVGSTPLEMRSAGLD